MVRRQPPAEVDPRGPPGPAAAAAVAAAAADATRGGTAG